MGIQKESNEPTLDEAIRDAYIRWKNSMVESQGRSAEIDNNHFTASKIASRYTEQELRMALVMRSAYDRSVREKKTRRGSK